MFLKDISSGHLVEVLSLNDLFNLHLDTVIGRYHWGEEIQDPERFAKKGLAFTSGEPLPKCWTDPHYRDDELKRSNRA